MIVPVIIAAVALAARSVRGAAYVGCVNPANIPGTPSDITSAGPDGCIDYCAGQASAYAFHSNVDGACTCSTSFGSSSNLQGSQNSGGSCASDQASTWILNTPFGFDGCFAETRSQSEMINSFPASPDVCFSACAAYGGAALTPAGGRYLCQCSVRITGVGAANCPAGSSQAGFYLYSQAIEPEPTGGNARRNLKERLRRAQFTKNQYCPAGLTGCIIGHDQEAFECVDTQTELESCGGCMNGLYGPTANNNLPSGADCSAIPNVALGGVTCSRGQCVVSACQYGYALADNQCVRMR